MRIVFAAAIGIMITGLVATSSLAFENTSTSGRITGRSSWRATKANPDRPRRKMTVAKGRATMVAENGFFGTTTSSFGFDGQPDGSVAGLGFFGGSFISMTTADVGGGPEQISRSWFGSFDAPYRRPIGSNGTRASLGNREIVLDGGSGPQGLEDFINEAILAESFPGGPTKRRRASTGLFGRISLTALRTGGSISVDRRTKTRYRGRAILRYQGVISTGPNADADVRGVISLRGTGNNSGSESQ